MKCNIFLSLLLVFFIILISINFVSASADNIANLTATDSNNLMNVNDNVVNSNLTSNPTSEMSHDKYIVNHRNYKMYFDETDSLKKEYGGSVIIFDGKFEDKGVITVASPDTKITGRHALFNNTVINIKSDGVIIANLNFVLDKEFPDNSNAGILIQADNVSVYNCSIKYEVPSEKTGFAIYSNGEDWGNTGVNIINNTINYIGKSYGNGFNYGVLLTENFNATVLGNIINCSLPLRAVDWMSEIYGGSSMDFAGAIVADTCRYLKLSGNKIYADVNGVRDGEPTLDAVLLYYCPDAIIENNVIKQTDYITKKGNVNYLYGLDMYLSNNVIVYGNIIDIFTNGGKEAHGTAYPIQITGPAKNVSIAFNKIKSYSNGPNIGIYSQNFYGKTELSIISNVINVTGYASSHSWALVAGIEVQDSNDIIMNNTIDVNSVNEFKTGYNLYGISYSQTTEGAHSYNIQYNKIKTSGDWAVALKGGSSSPVINSIIANNILNARKYGGNRAALITGGFGVVQNNTDGSKHIRKSMSMEDYPEFLKNYFKTSTNSNVDFSWISSLEDDVFSNNHKSGLGNGEGQGKSNFHIGDMNGKNMIYSKSELNYGDANSTYYIPGKSGSSIAAASASVGRESSFSKSYEITKTIKDLDRTNYINVIFSVFVIFLLLIGYKKREKIEEH